MTNLSENWLPRHRLTVLEYHRMAEVGQLAPDARVELIDVSKNRFCANAPA